MKKIATIVCAMVLSASACIANNSNSESITYTIAEASSARINVPTGIFFNGNNFIKVESTWIRIVINNQMKEAEFNSEMDPNGNYILKFGNGECITIYSNGRSLYYNGTTYSKKSIY